MNLIEIICSEKLIKVAYGSKFQKIADEFSDSEIIGFSSVEKNKNIKNKIFNLEDIITENLTIEKIYHKNLVANLLNVFSCVLKLHIVDYSFNKEENFIRECVVKFRTEENFSQSNFDQYKQLIKENATKVTKKCNQILFDMLNENHLFFLPFDFNFEKIAQEDFNGYKVQKFTIVIFKDSNDKNQYYENLKLLKEIDHRYIGKKLEYFMMIPEAPGSTFWLPKGWKLFRNLENFIRRSAYIGFNEVKTPLVMSNSFWQKSGHLISFRQNMMFVNMGCGNDEDSALKPMNCPAHIEIFQRKIRSYRDLPLRIAEFGCCHRYEPSGSLHGLMRVRSLTQDDGHIFCSMDQIKSEVTRFLNNCIDIYTRLGFEDVEVILATKPDNALGEEEEWILAEKYLAESLKDAKLKFSIANGEGAFYGPKIEMHVKDSIKRSWQLGTIQLDFVLPQRFNLSFVDVEGKKGKVCMLHRAILGSLERFIGVLLEHTKGHIPVFLSPVQVVVCSVNKNCNEYARKVNELLINSGINSEIDIREEMLSKKIKDCKLCKIPAFIVVGEKELEQNFITLEFLNKKMVFKINEMDKIMRLFNESR